MLLFLFSESDLFLFLLLFKNFNLGHNIWTVRDRAFIFHMCIPCDKNFHIIPYFYTPPPPPPPQVCGYIGITMSVCLSVRLSIRLSVESKLNLDHNFLTKGDRALILHKYIPCDMTFLSIPKFLTSWPWPWLLTYFWKNLTLAITFEPKEIGLSNFTCVFLVARPFCWNQNFLPCDLDLDFWPTFEKT